MSIGDFTILEQGSYTGRGGRIQNARAVATSINPGEPVATALASTDVYPCLDNAGVVASDYIVGVASTIPTNTTTLPGTVEVIPLNSGMTWLGNAAVAGTWDTQAKYDALVGQRVLISLAAGAYTILASDNSSNGLVVQPLNIAKYPGKVAFAFRQALSNLA